MRGVLFLLFMGVVTSVGSALAVVSRLFVPSGDGVVVIAQLWSRWIIRLFGVRVTVEQRAPLDPARPYVFMANHLSALDIWLMFYVIPRRVRMIAKKQLAYIPLLGWAMWAGRFIFIDRQNAVAARRSIEKARRRIAGGQSVLLFPEGTRSRDGRLAPFKKGGFHLAMDAGVPIVPVAIQGTHELMPPGRLTLRPGPVRVTLGAPIETAGVPEGDRAALIEKVRGTIAAALAVSAAPAGGEEAARPASIEDALEAEAGGGGGDPRVGARAAR